ncbi:MAG TPA: anti-sigma factor [Gaiellaceae bacterium]|nr:anti-sigma factor [Gaiellaceae bacterium]
MERAEIHELSAPYALDALDDRELEEFEEHLAHCRECRENVAAFQAAAGELAYDTDAPEPSPVLRNRILTQAASERPTVTAPPPPRRRWALPVAAAAAVAAGCAALALAFWAADLSQQVDDLEAQQHGAEEIAIMLADPDAERIPIDGANGALVVDSETQEGHLLLFGLEEAPEAHTYEAWVIEDGQALPAGLFSGGEDRATVVRLSEPVPAGAVVAVTVEVEGGVDRSEQQPIITSGPAA